MKLWRSFESHLLSLYGFKTFLRSSKVLSSLLYKQTFFCGIELLLQIGASSNGKPALASALNPKPVPHLLLRKPALNDCVLSKSMLLAFLPVPLVLSSIRPRVPTISMLLILLIFAFVGLFVGPRVNSNPMHPACEPLADIDAPIRPRVRSRSMNLVGFPLTLIGRAVLPLIDALSVFLAVFEKSPVFA